VHALDESRRVVRFGVFEVDLGAAELRKQGVRLRLQEQPFQILAALLERPGEIVAREELISLLWPDGTHVDYDRGLNAAVTRLRQVLSDSAETPRYIETIPRRGYRFIASLEPLEAARAAEHIEGPRLERKRTRVVALALALAVGVCLAAWWMLRPANRSAGGEPIAVPLTAWPGVERSPAISPDGNQVAFEWVKNGRSHIYLKLIGPGEPIQLTSGEANATGAAWSPDGRQIAFARSAAQGGSEMDLFVIPALGGVERRVGETIHTGFWSFGRPATWAPDGKHLIVCTRENPKTGIGVRIVPVEGGPSRWLLPPPENFYEGTLHTLISPGGNQLALSRKLTEGVSEISTLRLSADLRRDGDLQSIAKLNMPVFGLAWSADGKSILFAAGGNVLRPLLYRVAAQNPATPVALHSLGSGATSPSISKGGQFVFARHTLHLSIYRQEIPRDAAPAKVPIQLISTTWMDRNPQYSPDGTRIVFQSGRSGRAEVWTCLADGTQCVQVTRDAGGGTPRWSPNGKWIAYDSTKAGNFDIYIVPSEGGPQRQLTAHPAEDTIPSFSHDGKWIYFASARSGTENIWRVPFEGGEPVQITTGGGVRAFETHDGKFLYYTQGRGITTLLRKDLTDANAPDVPIVDGVRGREWCLTRDRLYCLRPSTTGAGPQLFYRILSTGQDRLVTVLPFGVELGLSATPDGAYVAYTRQSPYESDLMVVEDFR
jgi:Tol biopolymer transport system component/DNA-binding winged helix-turn-helix (wHTH) protein